MVSETKLDTGFMKVNSKKFFLLGSFMVSFGILIVTVGGSWDITNHLLSKPETFFSPPHGLMYTGVAITLFGVSISAIGWKNLQNFKREYFTSIKIQILGIGLLTGAGPFDFIWHSNFGLDGLLSPPHLTLITGMFLCAVGGMFAISRFLKFNNISNSLSYLHVLAIIPVWLSGSGLISSLSLPFSKTDYFDFNPEIRFAFIIATIFYPMIISTCLFLSSKLSNFKPGMFTILGGLFLLIYGSTAIAPNFALVDSLIFYSLNLIPLVVSDLIISFDKSKKSLIFVGGLIGSVFYMFYYPYVMYTYNEILLGKLVSPSLIDYVYFEIISQVIVLTIIPSIIVGIFGLLLSEKIRKKIHLQ